MSYSVRFSSIKNMLELCKKLTTQKVSRKDIEDVLDNEDYKFEFSRYKGRVSEDEYIDYLLELRDLREEDIKNIDLKVHHRYYKDLCANLDFYIEKFAELEKMLTQEMFNDQISVALKGLPNDLKLPDFNFIFTLGIGQSFGYVYGNNTHFDFLQLAKDKTISDFCSTIAHEVHHVGTNVLYEQLDMSKIPLEALFYLYFSGEGLAVKYCNNAEGALSKSIYSGAKNKGLDAFTWKYLNDDFYDTMANFKMDIANIRNNNIKNEEELNKRMEEYWMNPYAKGQAKDEIPKLKHFRLYSFGNDIWGIIHDCFGKNAVFETLNNPEKFPEMFNKALDVMGCEQYKI